MEQWHGACKAAQKGTGNTLLKRHHNWLMRVYIMAEKMNKFNGNMPDVYNRCRDDKVSLFYCLWQYLMLREFWEGLRLTVQEILLIKVELEPKFCLLRLYPK